VSDVVSTSATTQPITLADAKLQLNVSSTIDDTEITNILKAATQYTENVTNRAWVTQTRTLTMNGFYDPRYVHDGVIYPPISPLATVSSIKYTASDGTANTTLSTTTYTASTGDVPGRIFESYNNTWPTPRDVPNNVAVIYTCGYGSTQAVVPDNAKHAIRMLVSHWYRNREAASELPFREVPLTVDALLGNEMVPDYG